ncbi:NLR family CARD domain-containing protein 3 isoform X13 [Amia ocellicauda]|uniref:NLR family CARD domain-containing protein 3 isoform X13 n=1 Tax=Amia ocellicauda TaxID=2972642 RepID=UPI003463B97E
MGADSSKTSPPGEPEAQDAAVGPETKRVPLQRAESPVPSCVSMRSENSMDRPVTFRQEPFSPTPDPRVPLQRAESPVPSCVSMRSENSMDRPVTFRQEPFSPPPDPRVPLQRAESPVPSCVSMRSENSMDRPVTFRQEPFSPTPDPRVPLQRAESPVPSCVSMRSENSMDRPVTFRQEPFSPTPDPRVPLQRAESPVPSCVSMRSENSMDRPVTFRQEPFSPTPDPRVPLQRAESPVPSCVSMRSENSMDRPVTFRQEPFSPTPDPRAFTQRYLESTDVEMLAHSYARPGLVACDVCTGRKSRAVKSCLTCAASYCETHVRQHYTAPALQTHRLEDTTGDLEPRLCQQHRRALEVFCQTDQSWICSLCAVQEHRSHDINVDQAVRRAATVLPDHPEDFHPAGFLNTETPRTDGSLKTVQVNHKSILKKRFECVFEGIAEPGKHVLLNNIYTELYITEGDCGEVNNEHEVRQIEMAAKKKHTQETPIKCNDIFKPLPGQDKPIRTVLTKGIAGIGKTVSVQKFILDWAAGEANQDIHFIFFLPFRGLNLMREERYSLVELLCYYHPELKEVGNLESGKFTVLIIFDGLDESRLSLDFQNNQMCHDVTQSMSVDVLLTNLIRGNLLPSALLWITSRPAAASQIPAECVHQVTEVRGFNNEQKEEYFRKRVSDQSLASAIIKHIKSSRSLHIMCHIPVFCWISATVLERMLGESSEEVIPTTLTGMYTHFLLILTNMKNKKYLCKNEESTQNLLETERDNILKLCKLAFKHLQNGNLIFYTKDLKECDIDVSEASVYSGVCTEIFKEESAIFKKKVYCFVHLSIQEYLAALQVFFVYKNENLNLLNRTRTHSKTVRLPDLYESAVDEALQSKTGHLDLFLRFLLGISMDSNQTLLRGLLTQTHSSSQSIQKTTDYIKQVIRKNRSPERCINLFHCLNELNDNSLVEEIKSFLSSGRQSGRKLSSEQWSALVFVLLTSEESIDEFDLKKYRGTEEGCVKLLPVIKRSRRALLSGCGITEGGCAALASALRSHPSTLRELDLSHNRPGVSGVTELCALLEDPNCKLEKLWLSGCGITEGGCAALASALRSHPSTLRELDLSHNRPGVSGVTELCALLEDPNCKLETLQLSGCGITEGGCAALASALRSHPSTLRELDLSHNRPGVSGVTELSALLEDPNCKLQTLRLSGCGITEGGCAALASALRSNPSTLRELDLSHNRPGVSGVTELCALLEDPNCKLEKLWLSGCGITEGGCAALASALRSHPSTLRELDLSHNRPGVSGVTELCALLEDPNCKLEKLRLSWCGITEGGCAALASALRSHPSTLRELDLSHNRPGVSGVTELSALLEDPNCKLEKLRLSWCGITEGGCAALASALRSNPSTLRELDLRHNHPGDSGVTELSALLEDPNCKLETLRLSGCEITEGGCAALASALRSNPSTLRELDLNCNRPGVSGVTELSALLEDPNCKLQTLQLSWCGITEGGCAALASALRSNPSTLRELDLNYNQPGVSGVTELSALLEDPNCKLETLQMNCRD